MAGFQIDLALEKEEKFVASYKLNHGNTVTLNEDITKLNCEDIDATHVKNKSVKAIIGGPPCIGFSTVGNRRPNDPRNTLVYLFIQWVDYFRPDFFVMENVPGILSMASGKVVKDIVAMYKEIGYNTKIKTLLAADYGVPQLRQRVFFMGSQENVFSALKLKRTNQEEIAQKKLLETDELPPYLTVRDAISDILELRPFTGKVDEELSKHYPQPPQTEYQKYLRNGSSILFDHFAPNHGKLVVERISHINQGENHSSLPEKYQLKSGYPNIYGRLHLNKPADTITGNCGCVSAPGRFIHPTQDRAISVREAARFQSFPDNYRFSGNVRDRYKQVGNAVPPMMALALAKSIKELGV